MNKKEQTNNFLFCLIFLGFAILSSSLIPITNEVWDDISLILIVFSVISSIITLILSLKLFKTGKTYIKIISVIFILIIILFEYIGIMDFLTSFI